MSPGHLPASPSTIKILPGRRSFKTLFSHPFALISRTHFTGDPPSLQTAHGVPQILQLAKRGQVWESGVPFPLRPAPPAVPAVRSDTPQDWVWPSPGIQQPKSVHGSGGERGRRAVHCCWVQRLRPQPPCPFRVSLPADLWRTKRDQCHHCNFRFLSRISPKQAMHIVCKHGVNTVRGASSS